MRANGTGSGRAATAGSGAGTPPAARSSARVPPGSRHAELPSYELVLSAGAEPIVLFEPRVIPHSAAAAVHSVSATDRMDLLANRFFGDPFQFWRIADANPALVPEDVLDPGAEIAIPAKK